MRPVPRAIFWILPLVIYVAGCSSTKTVTADSGSADSGSFAITAPVTDRDAVIAAIQKHLRSNSGIKMNVMDINIGDVVVTGDKAKATAEFQLKQGGTSMQIAYALERHAGNWVVLSDQRSGGQFVHPPMDKTHSGTGANPGTPASSPQTWPDFTGILKNLPPVAETSPR